MVSKCANPECERTFHYMHEGKVFRLDLERVEAVSDLYEDRFAQRKEHRPRLQFFWLCNECAMSYTLVVHGGSAVTLEPLSEYEPLARAC